MNQGKLLEEAVQYVYSMRLNMRDEGIVVGRRVRIRGKSDADHEIDVYYQFEKAGILHRVAIECKDWDRAVSKGEVLEFEAKIRDVGNLVGVMVSRNGYQDGAKTFAGHSDIIMLTADELPSLGSLLAARIESVALPDKDYVGEPFWVIMQLRDGEVTGSHFGMPDEPGPRSSPGGVLPLFYSKAQAQRFFTGQGLDDKNWAIRGLPKHAFRGFLACLWLYEKRRIQPIICLFAPGALDAGCMVLRTTRDLLIAEYFDGVDPMAG